MTKYFITFIHDKSRKTIVYFLKCKSEVSWGKELKSSKVMEVENTFLMNLKNFVNNTISLNFWDGFHDLVDLHGTISFSIFWLLSLNISSPLNVSWVTCMFSLLYKLMMYSPQILKEALERKNAIEWMSSVREEYKSLTNN